MIFSSLYLWPFWEGAVHVTYVSTSRNVLYNITTLHDIWILLYAKQCIKNIYDLIQAIYGIYIEHNMDNIIKSQEDYYEYKSNNNSDNHKNETTGTTQPKQVE